MLLSRSVLLLRLSVLGLLTAAPTAPLVAQEAQSRPNLNQSLDRTTEDGMYRVRIRSAVTPVPMNAAHSWEVQVTDAEGKPVSGAVLTASGGMPERKQALPAVAHAAAAFGAGNYVIEGIKFSTGGWWELKLVIEAADGVDSVTFNIVL